MHKKYTGILSAERFLIKNDIKIPHRVICKKTILICK